MASSSEWTLTQAAELLGEPQHRLIYFCEKGVVQPAQDAVGRGSSRRFSVRNLLDFAVALRMRELELPLGPIRGVIHVLHAFEKTVRKEIDGFRMPEGLRVPDAPDLRAVISDGSRLYFTLGNKRGVTGIYGAVELARFSDSESSVPRRLSVPRQRAKGRPGEFGMPEGSRHTRLEVSITKIARELPLER